MADVEQRFEKFDERLGNVESSVEKLSTAVFGSVEDEDNVKDGLVRIVRDLRKDSGAARKALYLIIGILVANTGLAQHVEIGKLIVALFTWKAP